MERLVVNHQRRRKVVKSPEGFQTDHIIPYCISLNNNKENLQFLRKEIHKKKSIIDFKIIKLFRKNGWIEKITNYSHELKKPIPFLVREYIKEFNKLGGLVELEGLFHFNSHIGKLTDNYYANTTNPTNYT